MVTPPRGGASPVGVLLGWELCKLLLLAAPRSRSRRHAIRCGVHGSGLNLLKSACYPQR